MNLTDLTIATAFILFVCTSIRSAIGFGDALLAMPLLGMIMSLRTATPLVALTGFIISSMIIIFDQDSIDLKSAWRLIISTIIGVPFGLFLLQYAPEKTVKMGLGIILILYGLYNLVSPKFPQLRHERYAVFFGLVAGVLGGAYNINGLPIAVYGVMRRWSASYFRATMQCYFLFSGIATIAGHGFAGLWTPQVWRLFLWSIPSILIGIYVGGKINRLIPQPMFNRLIFSLLIIVGCIFLL
jgi:uncharacterized membrane protein YfcA